MKPCLSIHAFHKWFPLPSSYMSETCNLFQSRCKWLSESWWDSWLDRSLGNGNYIKTGGCLHRDRCYGNEWGFKWYNRLCWRLLFPLMAFLSVFIIWPPVPPVVEPTFQDIRQGLGRSVTLRCTMLKGSPMKVATAVWRFNGNLLTLPPAEQQDYSELKVDSVIRDTSGSYECSISNDVGVSTCLFQVSGESCRLPCSCSLFNWLV